MKASYFIFLAILLCSVDCIKLKKTCKGCPSTTTATPTTTTTTTPAATTTTTPAATTTTTPAATTTTTTTPAATTTSTTTSSTTSASASLGRRYGTWVLTEDNTVPTPAGWYPQVSSTYPFNTYWLSFLNPNTIFANGSASIPSAAFTQFSLNRNAVGGPKSTDKVLYSIGGYSYSQPGQNWPMFSSNANAQAFAQAVVSWKKNFLMDGFDLDWETASASATQIQAVYTFLTTIKSLDPTILITVEEAGYPQYMGAALISYALGINALSTLYNTVDYFNVMFYSTDPTTNALYWVQSSWQKSCTSWCALGTLVPSNKIILGLPGCCSQAATQASLKAQMCATGPDGLSYAGYMVWYVSSNSTPNIVYGGVCSGSEGCQMTPANAAANFALPSC